MKSTTQDHCGQVLGFVAQIFDPDLELQEVCVGDENFVAIMNHDNALRGEDFGPSFVENPKRATWFLTFTPTWVSENTPS